MTLNESPVPTRTDVLIIGGGALGAAVAYAIRVADPSVEVVVVERDPTYSLASTPRAAGGVRRLFSLPENIELSKYSIPIFENFESDMAVDGEAPNIAFKKNGYLFIMAPGEPTDVLRANYELQVSMGCNVIWLEPDEIKARWPSMYVGDLGAAAFSPDDGWLDPHSTLLGYRRKAISLGARFVADEIAALEHHATTVTAAVLGSGHRVVASHFVNAAGAWAKQITEMLGFSIPIEPMRRYEHFFKCQDEIEPLPYLKDLQRLAFRPEGPGYSGGVPTLAEPRGYNFGVDPDYFDNAVWPALAHRFPKFERTKCLSTMSGLYDQNELDASAIIGPGAGGFENFHMLAGFSGHGLMHAPGCGRGIAELILTGAFQTIDLSRFGWQRVLDNAPLRERGIV